MSSPSLDFFNRKLGEYIEVSGKNTDEVLGKKGRDLGIRLFKGFSDHKFGGPGKAIKNLARSELDARRARGNSEGNGIRVRPSLLAQYASNRVLLARSTDSVLSHIGPRSKAAAALARRKIKDNRRIRRNLWRKTVGLELGRRQSGIGALAASFLWFRKYTTKAAGTTLVPNRTGRPIGSVQRGPGFLRILAQNPGIETVDQRYLIVQGALSDAAGDIIPYLLRKAREAAQKLTA